MANSCPESMAQCKFSREYLDTFTRLHGRMDEIEKRVTLIEASGPTGQTFGYLMEANERHLAELKNLIGGLSTKMDQYQRDVDQLKIRLATNENGLNDVNARLMQDAAAAMRIKAEAWTQRVSQVAGVMFVIMVAAMVYYQRELASLDIFQWIVYGSIANLFKDGIASAIAGIKKKIMG